MFRFYDTQTGLFYNFKTETWGPRGSATLLEGTGIRTDSQISKQADAIWKHDHTRYEYIGEFGSVDDSIKLAKFKNLCAEFAKGDDPNAVVVVSPDEMAKLLVFHIDNPTKRMIIKKPSAYDDPEWVAEMQAKMAAGASPGLMDEILLLEKKRSQEMLDELLKDLGGLNLNPGEAAYDFLAFEDSEGFLARLAKPDAVISLPKLYKQFIDHGFNDNYFRLILTTNVEETLFGKRKKTNMEETA